MTRAIGDELGHEVVAVGLAQSGGAPALYRCGMDGTRCSVTPTAAGNQYFSVDVTIDPESGQAFIVGASNDGELYLFYLE